MAVLPILQFPNDHLRRVGDQVTDFGPALQSTIDDMLDTLKHTEHCAGLAANQMGLNEHITVISANHEIDETLCLVNAKITKKSGEATEIEGCMSIAGGYVHAAVKRATKITLTWQDRNGKAHETEFTDFTAKAIQHELDHLAGIVFIDHLGKIKRKMVDRKLVQMQGKLPVQTKSDADNA